MSVDTHGQARGTHVTTETELRFSFGCTKNSHSPTAKAVELCDNNRPKILQPPAIRTLLKSDSVSNSFTINKKPRG